MTETRIRRGGGSRLSTGKSIPRTERPRGGGKGRKTSPINMLLARLPFSHAAMQRAMTWGIVAIVGGAMWIAASFFGLPGMAHMELAELAARSGYEVEKVEVRGTRKMDEMAVYSIALGEVDRSMLNVDLNKLRAGIMTLSWVKDARVSRRLPDTLVVDIVEREPAAVWQNQGKLALIDATGVVLEPVSPDALPDLPLLVGDDANRQAERFARLMEAAPALKPLLSGATWVGNRRWDLRFQSGETLALPEGDALAAAALVDFARLDGINRLLGRGITRFDMRDPDRLVLRMPKGRAAPAMVGSQSDVTMQPDEEKASVPATEEPQALASQERG